MSIFFHGQRRGERKKKQKKMKKREGLSLLLRALSATAAPRSRFRLWPPLYSSLLPSPRTSKTQAQEEEEGCKETTPSQERPPLPPPPPPPAPPPAPPLLARHGGDGSRYPGLDPSGFAERLKSISKIRNILKGKLQWSPDVAQTLASLDVDYNAAVVGQVIMSDISTSTALDFFHWLKDHASFKHNYYTYGVMVGSLARQPWRYVNEVLALAEDFQARVSNKSDVSFHNLICWYGIAGRLDKVQEVWKEMEEARVRPKLASFNTLMDLLLKEGQFEEALGVYKGMVQGGCTPNAITWSMFMRVLVANGCTEAAHTLFRSLAKLKSKPTAYQFSMMVSASAAAGDTAAVRELGRGMRLCSDNPIPGGLKWLRVITRDPERRNEAESVAAELWPDLSLADRAAKLPSEVEPDPVDDDDGIGPSKPDYDPCINVNALASSIRDWDPASVSSLGNTGILWTSSLVLEILRRCRRPSTAWKFFDWVQNEQGFTHDGRTTSKMIMLLAIDRKVVAAEQLLHSALQKQMEVSIAAMNTLIKAYARLRRADMAMRILNLVETLKLNPNVETFENAIRALTREKWCIEGRKLLDHMNQLHLRPTPFIYSRLIDCFAAAGRVDLAHNLFTQMRSTMGIEATPDVYGILIKAYFSRNQPKVAFDLFGELKRSGNEPPHDLIETVVKELDACGLTEVAQRVRTEHPLTLAPVARKGPPLKDLLEIHDLMRRSLVKFVSTTS